MADMLPPPLPPHASCWLLSQQLEAPEHLVDAEVTEVKSQAGRFFPYLFLELLELLGKPFCLKRCQRKPLLGGQGGHSVSWLGTGLWFT